MTKIKEIFKKKHVEKMLVIFGLDTIFYLNVVFKHNKRDHTHVVT